MHALNALCVDTEVVSVDFAAREPVFSKLRSDRPSEKRLARHFDTMHNVENGLIGKSRL